MRLQKSENVKVCAKLYKHNLSCMLLERARVRVSSKCIFIITTKRSKRILSKNLTITLVWDPPFAVKIRVLHRRLQQFSQTPLSLRAQVKIINKMNRNWFQRKNLENERTWGNHENWKKKKRYNETIDLVKIKTGMIKCQQGYKRNGKRNAGVMT